MLFPFHFFGHVRQKFLKFFNNNVFLVDSTNRRVVPVCFMESCALVVSMERVSHSKGT